MYNTYTLTCMLIKLFTLSVDKFSSQPAPRWNHSGIIHLRLSRKERNMMHAVLLFLTVNMNWSWVRIQISVMLLYA